MDAQIVALIRDNPNGRTVLDTLQKILRFLLDQHENGSSDGHRPNDSLKEKVERFLTKIMMNLIQKAVAIVNDNVMYLARLLLDAIEHIKRKYLTNGESESSAAEPSTAEPSATEPPIDLCPGCLKSFDEPTDDLGIFTFTRCNHQYHSKCWLELNPITDQCIICANNTGSTSASR